MRFSTWCRLHQTRCGVTVAHEINNIKEVCRSYFNFIITSLYWDATSSQRESQTLLKEMCENFFRFSSAFLPLYRTRKVDEFFITQLRSAWWDKTANWNHLCPSPVNISVTSTPTIRNCIKVNAIKWKKYILNSDYKWIRVGLCQFRPCLTATISITSRHLTFFKELKDRRIGFHSSHNRSDCETLELLLHRVYFND